MYVIFSGWRRTVFGVMGGVFLHKWGAKFCTPPPTPEKTPLGVYKRGGGIKFLAWGGSKYTPPPPLPLNMPCGQTSGEGVGAYIISPWNKLTSQELLGKTSSAILEVRMVLSDGSSPLLLRLPREAPFRS